MAETEIKSIGGRKLCDEQARKNISDLKSGTVILDVVYDDGTTDALVLYGEVE